MEYGHTPKPIYEYLSGEKSSTPEDKKINKTKNDSGIVASVIILC